MQHVRIRAKAGAISVSGTDLGQWLEYRTNAETAEPADWIVELAKLREFVNGSGGKCMLTMEPAADNALKVSFDVAGQRVERVFPSTPADEWPVFPACPQELTPVKADLFAAIRDAMPSASRDMTRRVLHSVLLCRDSVVATDARHLVRLDCAAPLEDPVIVPVTKPLASGLLKDDGAMAVTGKDGVLLVHFESGAWRYMVKSVEGCYPNYRQVIPDGDRLVMKVRFTDADVESLTKALPAFEKGDDLDGVALYAGAKGVRFLTTKPGGTAMLETQAACEGPQEHSVVVFDRSFLLRAFELGLNELRFGVGHMGMVPTGSRGTMVYMPLRVNNVGEYFKRLGIEYKPTEENTDMTKKNEVGAPQAVPQQTADQEQKPQAEAPAQKPQEQQPKPESATSLRMTGGNGTNGLNGNGSADPFEQLQAAVVELKNAAKAFNDAINGLQRKIADAQRAVKQKEKDFKSTRDILDKLKSAANF